MTESPAIAELDMARREWLRDDERRRIARELHDHAEQTFFAIGLTATAALDSSELRSGAAPRLAQALTEVRQMAAAGAEQLRTAIFALNQNAEFAAPGLVAALWKQIRAFQTRTGIEADLALSGARRRVPTEVAEVLHAVTCEALTNVERHAHARAVVLGLRVGQRSISLSVQDDGTGGSPLMLKHLSNSATRFGLRGMRDRVKGLRGTLLAGPGPDGGFLVRVRIPLRPVAAE